MLILLIKFNRANEREQNSPLFEVVRKDREQGVTRAGGPSLPARTKRVSGGERTWSCSLWSPLAQGPTHGPVRLRYIKSLRIELAAAPALEVLLLLDLVGLGAQQHAQELDVAVRPADILGRT